jgi:hypothetical protein
MNAAELAGRELTTRHWLRMLVLVPLASFMLWSPIDQHVGVRGSGSKYTHGWKFFHGYGIGVCDVAFYLEGEGGREEIDRYAALNYVPDNAPEWLRRIRQGRAETPVPLPAVIQRVCRGVEKTSLDRLRVQARCAGREGWETVYTGKEHVCSGNVPNQKVTGESP